MKIYTRTGDKGETSLFGGKRVHKDDLRVEAYGTIDELNASIGLAVAEAQSEKRSPREAGKAKNYSPRSEAGSAKLKAELAKVQSDLFEVAAVLATPKDTRVSKGQKIQKELPQYLYKRVEEMEHAIDALTEEMPSLRAFILPGGGRGGALLHQARTVCRRAERRIVGLAQRERVPSEILTYMNRLSDLLFTMARFVNHKEKHKEILWNKYQGF